VEIIKRAIFISLLGAIMIFFGQSVLLVRVFLWEETPLPGLSGWTITDWFATIMLVDFVPLVPLWYACILSPLHSTKDLFGKSLSY